jgi:hypothetical protein
MDAAWKAPTAAFPETTRRGSFRASVEVEGPILLPRKVDRTYPVNNRPNAAAVVPTLHCVKHCGTCGQMKALDAFARDRRHADGLQYRCRSCRSLARRGLDGNTTTAQERAHRLWGVLSPEGRARAAQEFERSVPGDVDVLAELGGLDSAT